MLKDFPDELRGPLSHLAYERGHAYGNREILSELSDIVDALQEPVQNLMERVRQTTE